jgi:hypothetical protein
MDVNREIRCSLSHFMQFLQLDVSEEQLEQFYDDDIKRKSLSKIGYDCILASSEYLSLFQKLLFARTCKEFYKNIDVIRMQIVAWYYPMNLLPKNPVLQWKQLCADWVLYKREQCNELNIDFKNIMAIEKPLKYCQQELKNIDTEYCITPLPQTIISVKTYKCQIMSELKELDNVWDMASECIYQYYEFFHWMISDTGLLLDIPQIDDLLYGGITKEEMLSQINLYKDSDSD